ncbi:hypothetical protein GCM10023152_11150 [Agromyces bauzanensis]|uniref:Uncharacterized protein n=1 Tax=Agromyces bauzanensis TaxID=1308924 RepID=A0A917P9G0_9MICO|nr:hypothetical protein GCM10011372_01780 [Agromyces bauzanensis]
MGRPRLPAGELGRIGVTRLENSRYQARGATRDDSGALLRLAGQRRDRGSGTRGPAEQSDAAQRDRTIEDVELDDPKHGEVLVKLAASGLCHSDEHVVTGDIPVPAYRKSVFTRAPA